jgi:hypothetical protein
MSDKNDPSISEETIDSKVANVISKYDLGEEHGKKLEDLWTAEGDERESLRTLATRLNKRILAAAMNDAGMTTVDGEVANLYRLLTEETVTSGNRKEVRRRLEQNDIDTGQFESDLVTYQAIRSYLKDYRNTEHETQSTTIRTDDIIETLQRLQSRVRSVSKKSLTQLIAADRLTLGTFRIFIEIDVFCEDCGKQYGIFELLESGSCDCITDN